MQKIMSIIFILFIAIIASCSKFEQDDTVLPPSNESILKAKQISEEWSKNHKEAADLSEEELIKAVMALEGINIHPDIKIASFSDMKNSEQYSKYVKELSRNELWRTKQHLFGFIEKGVGESDIINANSLQPDITLKGAKIKITLDRLKIMKYPGRGTHNVVFNFHSQTQSIQDLIPLSYSVGVTAREEDEPAIVGKSIFVGLCVGTEGIDLKGNTINVNTRIDKNFFTILAGNIFSQGLRLIDQVQPALQPLTELADGVSKELSDLNKGIPVQEFDIGLDFSPIPTRIKLREGSYIILQIPPSEAAKWKWSEWVFKNGHIENRNNPNQVVNYNYIIIGLSRIIP